MNLLLSRELGTVKIADFGLAFEVDATRLTTAGKMLGTISFMSPEQILGKQKEVDARTDIYALGVTLFQLLTLELPFAGKTNELYINAVLVVGGAAAEQAQRAGRPRPGDRDPQGAGEIPPGTLRLRGGLRRRPRERAAPEADPGPAAVPSDRAVEVDAAQADPRRAARHVGPQRSDHRLADSPGEPAAAGPQAGGNRPAVERAALVGPEIEASGEPGWWPGKDPRPGCGPRGSASRSGPGPDVRLARRRGSIGGGASCKNARLRPSRGSSSCEPDALHGRTG